MTLLLGASLSFLSQWSFGLLLLDHLLGRYKVVASIHAIEELKERLMNEDEVLVHFELLQGLLPCLIWVPKQFSFESLILYVIG